MQERVSGRTHGTQSKTYRRGGTILTPPPPDRGPSRSAAVVISERRSDRRSQADRVPIKGKRLCPKDQQQPDAMNKSKSIPSDQLNVRSATCAAHTVADRTERRWPRRLKIFP